jgi:hypothetical protein
MKNKMSWGLLSENDLLLCVSVIAAVPNSLNKFDFLFFFHEIAFLKNLKRSSPTIKEFN